MVALAFVDDDDSPIMLLMSHHRIDLMSETLKKSEGFSKLEHWSNDDGDHFSSCLKLLELLLPSHFLQPKRHKKLYAL